MPIVSFRVVLVVNILICQYFDRDEINPDNPHYNIKKKRKNTIEISFSSVAGFAWQTFVRTLIALLSGRTGVQILNICPCIWTGNPPLEVDGHMNSNREKKTGRNEDVHGSSAVARFRKPLVDYLISGLEENDKWVRILAIDMLGGAGDPRAVGYLKPLLVDRDRDLRTISAQAMDMIHSQQAIVSRSQPDRCASCMIRFIAEEALTQAKSREKLHV
jgi:hypothetical protein